MQPQREHAARDAGLRNTSPGPAAGQWPWEKEGEWARLRFTNAKRAAASGSQADRVYGQGVSSLRGAPHFPF